MEKAEGSIPSADMSPTKIYIVFWIGIMTLFLVVSGALVWQLQRIYTVLVEILKHMK